MRILFTRFPLESAFGGAEIQTLSLMKGLKARGHGVSFVGSCATLLREAASCELSAASLIIGKPPVTKWEVIRFVWKKKMMKENLISYFETSQHAARSTQLPTAVFMLSLTEKLLLTSWLAAQGVKVFWIEHDRIGRWLTWNPWLPLLRKESQHATIVTVSELSKKFYEDIGFDPKRIVAIPNGIDLQRFHDLPLATSHLSLRVGSIARLSPEKGLDVLLDAVSDLSDVSLTIVGSGREEGYLRKIIDERGMSDRVVIKKHVDDLGAFYQSLDLFVLPSTDHDPFGLVAAEAMNLGIATIVTDACGIAGYVENGIDARIVPAGDTKALRDAISQLSNEKERSRIAANGNETARREFDAEKMVEKYERLVVSG